MVVCVSPVHISSIIQKSSWPAWFTPSNGKLFTVLTTSVGARFIFVPVLKVTSTRSELSHLVPPLNLEGIKYLSHIAG